MRFKPVMLIVVLTIGLSSLALSTNCGTNWLGNDAVGNDPDFNVAARELGYAQPASASAQSRIAPDERPNTVPKSQPNMDMPDPTPKPLGSYEKSQKEGLAGNVTENQSTDAAPGTSAAPAATAKTIDVSGKWSVDLGTGDYMDLILIQSGNTIMGSGSLVEDGVKIPLTLSGTLDGTALDIDARSVVADYVNKVDREYEISLTMVNKRLSGSYEAYTSRELIGSGNATAQRP